MAKIWESSGNSKSVKVHEKALLSPKGSWTLKELGIELKRCEPATKRDSKK